MKHLKPFVLIYCCFFCFSTYAQSPKKIEEDLLKSFKKIHYWNEQRGKDTSLTWVNNLEEANEVFGSKLKNYTGKFPFTLRYPFRSLKKEHLDIISSADGLFRIYSWDTWQGGTMHDFENVLQYKSGGKVTSILDTAKSDEDYVCYYKAKKTLYIPLIDETGKMTHQFILYKFNGKYFEKVKNSLNGGYLKV